VPPWRVLPTLTHGRQSTNADDLRSFVAAVEGRARNNLDRLLSDDNNTASIRDAERELLCADVESGGPDNRPTGEGTPSSGEGEGLHAGGVKDSSPLVNPIEIDNFDLDSIPPTPVNASSAPTASDNRNDHALAQEIAALSAELGDDAPRSSLGRARNLYRDASVSLDRFLRLLDEAATRTRDRQASIVKRRRDGQAPNGMPYLSL